MIPMRDPRHHNAINIGENLIHQMVQCLALGAHHRPGCLGLVGFAGPRRDEDLVEVRGEIRIGRRPGRQSPFGCLCDIAGHGERVGIFKGDSVVGFVHSSLLI